MLYLNELFERSGFRSVISNPSSSPLEIPSLYENAVSASKYWKQKSVIIYSEFASSLDNKSNFSYPHKQLEELALHLKNHSFTQIHDLLDELFALINENILQSDVFSVFFIRCILIDILTAIITAMNQYNIKFKSYQDVYFEALFLCRSCPYEDENKNIYKHFLKLINIFETQVENSSVDPAQIRSLVQQNYTSPDFSISSIADTFQISVAYMSYVFKKEFNQNFSDYLWELRLKKAKELLTTTTMSIESVSISIGYINTSSFRRKFKQETGVTPSQYRDLYTSSQSTDS